MRILINDTEIIFPASLREITLGQRIEFYEQHGKLLEEMASSILAMDDGIERETEAAEYQFEKMFRTVAFFANTTPEALKDSDFIDQAANIYYTCLAQLFDAEAKLDLKAEFEWNGEVWQLHPAELKHGSQMTFGEFIDAKQMIKDMQELGTNNWEYLQKLCAIFLRRQDEQYSESFLYEGSERLELLRSLPLDIAMTVGFFLTSSLNIYTNISRFSLSPGLKDQVKTHHSILTGGDGLTS